MPPEESKANTPQPPEVAKDESAKDGNKGGVVKDTKGENVKDDKGKDAKDGKDEAVKVGKGGKLADYEPPAVTDANVMEVIANGNRRITEAGGNAIIDLSNMGDSDSTALCAMLEWIAEGKKQGGKTTFRNIQPRQTKMLSLYQLTPLITPHCQQEE